VALNDRQAAFVREYVRCGNAAEAYRAAGYKAQGHAAEVNASRLLRNAEVFGAVEKARAQVEQEGIVTRREVFEGLKREALGQPGSRAVDRIAAWEVLARLLGIQKRAELKAEAELIEAEAEAEEAAVGRRARPQGELATAASIPLPGMTNADH
jgi:phage terminase small subunit